MRFGKTFATYQLAKSMNFKRVLVLTFKPAVESAWQEDLLSSIDFAGWQFVSNKEAKFDAKELDEQFDECDGTKPIVVFGSFQDLLGTNSPADIKAKNEFIHTTNWDLVVFDEYHFGAWRENAKIFLKNSTKKMTISTLKNIKKKRQATQLTSHFCQSLQITIFICQAHRSER